MELLFQAELRRILESRELSDSVARALEVPVEQLSSDIPAFRSIQIEEARNPEFGFAASGLPFALAKYLKERVGREVPPLTLAEAIDRSIDAERFAHSIGGGGFLNFDPTDSLIRRFLLEPPLRSFQPPLTEISWGAKYLQKELTKNEEARFFVAALRERQGERCTKEDAQQLLALLGDPELEGSTYLRGFGGRSNAPWYLERFLSVTERYEGPSASALPVAFRPGQLALLVRMLHFRHRFSTHLEQNRPERAMRELLALVADFFGLFNRPEARVDSDNDQLFSVTREFVVIALGALKLPCELPVRVL